MASTIVTPAALRLMVLATALTVGVVPAVRADGSLLTVAVTTDRAVYGLGEPVEITVTLCNPTQEPITLTYGCPCCHDRLLALDRTGVQVSELGVGCIQPVWVVTWLAGECRSNAYVWQQLAPVFDSGDPVAPGRYGLRHVFEFPTFVTVTESAPIVIQGVAAVEVPTLDPRGALALVLGLVGASLWLFGRWRSVGSQRRAAR